MKNVTLAIEDKVLKRARVRAIGEGTTVNSLVREYLERYAGGDVATAARSRFLRLAHGSAASSGRTGRRWTREELHER